MMSAKSPPTPERSTVEEISRLLPASKQWMIERGYLRRLVEDGETVYAITSKGYAYLADPSCKEPKS